MTRKAIVFDLDDTLISTQRRHHEAYCRIVLLSGKEHPVSFDQYVSFRSKYGYSNAQATKELHDIDEAWSLELWRSIIESNFFLKYDSQIVIDNYLQLAREGHDLYLLSLRANRESAYRQVNSFNFAQYFTEFFFVKHDDRVRNPKVGILELLRERQEVLGFVGDSGKDMEAAKVAGVPFFGVRTGLRVPEANAAKEFPTVNDYLRALIKKE